jgi:serine/threonine protein kinase
MITDSAKNVFKELRDGDRRTHKEKKMKVFDMDEDEESDNYNDGFLQAYDPDADLRIEGTTIYLPPEVVSGAFPTLAADSWALGCVLYQCLTGRPPIIEDDETLAKNRIVSFDVKNSRIDEGDLLFGDSKTAKMEQSAQDLITELMSRDANERPTMIQVSDHSFFQDSGMDIFTLWRQPALKLEVGDSAPPPADAGWARRQLSTIWAPQPQAYDIASGDSKTLTIRSNGRGLSGPISEGAEAPFFFSKANILPSVRSASQIVPLPPRKEVAEV